VLPVALGDEPWALTVAALVMVSFAGFLRYSDAAVIRVGDVKFVATHMELFLERRKTDQFRQGAVLIVTRGSSRLCPVALAERLVRALGSSSGGTPLFQGFDGHAARAAGRRRPVLLNGSHMSYAQARYHVLKFTASALGMSKDAAQKRFGLHSLRSGGASAVVNAPPLSEQLNILGVGATVDHTAFLAHGGWADARTARRYLVLNMDVRLGVTAALAGGY